VPLWPSGRRFSFVIMMFNVPIPGGSTGHAVGGVLAAILLGPWAAMIAITVALVVQALLFGDGGITAIGANCFNMAVVIPFIGYYTFRLIAGSDPTASSRRAIAAGVAGYIGINAAALLAAWSSACSRTCATPPPDRRSIARMGSESPCRPWSGDTCSCLVGSRPS